MSEERIVAALRALAESDRDREASREMALTTEYVEARLRQAFRRRLAARRWKSAAMGAAAAAIAILVLHGSGQRQRPARAIVIAGPSVQQPAPPAEAPPMVSRPARRPTRVRHAPPREVMTDFFPLIDVAPEFGRGELVRLTVPAATMLTVGLPVREDRLADTVQADVLIGEEGLARAIRFVKLEQ